jgi:hypothetical protein
MTKTGLTPNIPPAKDEAMAEAALEKLVAVTPRAREYVKIILEDNEDIPPTGLFVGLNGEGFMIRPGYEVRVPIGVVEILQHAITHVATKDPQTNRYIGSRPRQRFPFRFVGPSNVAA